MFGGWFSLNGNGEMTGTAWIEESGFVEGPILLTNTHSVGIVRDTYLRWMLENKLPQPEFAETTLNKNSFLLPVVAETSDIFLNDMNGFHVREKHVIEALETASGGIVREGNVGAGTGMICYKFKAGIGTASRIIDSPKRGTVGVLVQANCGKRHHLTISGVPVGLEIPEEKNSPEKRDDDGSIIILIATDLPLLPHQAKRLARRATMGLARTGATAANGSGDLFLAFSTAEIKRKKNESEILQVEMLPNDQLNQLFDAVVEATEEAIVNSLVAAETMVGKNGRCVPSIPLERLVSTLQKYSRWKQPAGEVSD